VEQLFLKRNPLKITLCKPQPRFRTVHGKDSVCGDEAAAATLGRLQLFFQLRQILMFVAIPRGFAQPNPVN
jgi:hypothetical protein